MVPSPRKRTFTRMPAHVDAEVHVDDRKVATGRVFNVSMSGISIETDDVVAPRQVCTIDLLLGGGADRVCIKLTGRVMRRHEGTLAFELDSIDPGGYEHFLNLLLYNAPDARAFEEEIAVGADSQPAVTPKRGTTSDG